MRFTDETIPLVDDMMQVNAKGGFAPAEAFAIHRERLQARGASVDPNIRVRIERGGNVSAADYIDMAQERARLVRAMDARIGRSRCAGAADDADRRADDRRGCDADEFGRKNMLLLRNTDLVNFFDLCAISLPLPRGAGLPAGLMLVGRNGQDRRLFDIAAAVERQMPRERLAYRQICYRHNNRLPRGAHASKSPKSSREEVMAESQRVTHAAAACWPAPPPHCAVAAPAIVRAQGAALKVGVLLPRSGAQASIGQDCQRGVDVAPGRSSRSSACPSSQIMNADTETNVEVARARAEKLIADGAQLLVGAFDSGQSTAIAQVAEQKGIPFVINIAAAPPITEQGYKFVFRNFPTAPMILGDAFANQKEMFEAAGTAPKTVVFMHVNDTFGTAMQKGIGAVMPKFNMPYTIKETIAYDPTARDLSVEVSKAKATGADALLVVSRLNDAILITREMVKQRWSPMGVLSMGPGWYEDQYLKTLGKLGRRAAELRALVRPEQEAEQGARGRARQDSIRASISTPTTSTLSRRCWSPPTPTSAPARPIRRRWPTRSARPTSPTTSAPAPASSSTPRARTTS